MQRHMLGKSQQSEETNHSANCPCCSGSIRTRGKLATARAGSATPTRLSAQPVGLQHLLQSTSACNPAKQIATCPYSISPSKGSHPLPRGSRKTRCTNHVHSTPLSANTATTTKQKPRSAAIPVSSMFPPSPTERGPRSAAQPAYSRHHSAGQVRGEKADSAAEGELKALRQENAKLQSQLARLRSLRSQEEAARDSDFSADMPQVFLFLPAERCISSGAAVMKHPCHGTMHAFNCAVNVLFARSCAIANVRCSCIDKYLSKSTSLQMVWQQTQPCNAIAVYSVMTPTTGLTHNSQSACCNCKYPKGTTAVCAGSSITPTSAQRQGC